MKWKSNFYDSRASAIVSRIRGKSDQFVHELFQEVRENTSAALLLNEDDGLLCKLSCNASMGPRYRSLQNELKSK